MTGHDAVLDEWLHACNRCGTCKYVFRVYEPSCPSGAYFRFESYYASGRIAIARGLLTGALEWDDSLVDPVFACTTCGSCEVQCLAPHSDSIVEIIEALRAMVVSAHGAPPVQARLLENTLAHNNPYGEQHVAGTLAREYRLPRHAEVVYFVGCTATYRERAIRDATVSVLQRAGVDLTIVDEHCCGSPLLRTGQRDAVNALAEHNLREFDTVGASLVVTSCAGCYRALTVDYPRMGLHPDIPVLHSSQFVLQLIGDGRLTLAGPWDRGAVTYHDPCHLGRACGVYDPPRQVLAALSVPVTEMRLNRENSWCCGAGGGAKAAYPEWSLQTAAERIRQAAATGAPTIVTACPFCVRALRDATPESGPGVMDLVQVVDLMTRRGPE